MNLYKRSISLILAVAITLSFIGCTSTKKKEPPVGKTPVENPVDNNKFEKVVITDHLGREITMKEKPKVIVSGYYITSSMLIALGLEDNIAGIEAKAKSRPIYSLAAPQLLKLPNVGTAKEFNLEGCIALKPDLVILPIKLKSSVKSLEDLGINVIAVNPENMELLKETITIIGKLTGTEDKANKLTTYYDTRISEMSKLIDTTNKAKIYLGGNSGILSTATGKMYQNYMIETAGGINVASKIDDTYWATISYEQLLNYNPDVIIIVPEAKYTKKDILNDKKLSALKAVQNDKIYVMPDSFEAWDSPVPSSILGTMWLTSILNEEKYSFDTFKNDVSEFYKEFYNFNVDKNLVTK